MGILSGNPKDEPMHYGEVFSTWSFVMATNGAVSQCQMLMNHVGDDDLKKLIQEKVEKGQAAAEQVSILLKENGVALPPSMPAPPTVELNDIPVGARFQDPAISAAISAEVALGLVTCSEIIGQSIREDVAMMFGQFHLEMATLGAKFLKLNKDKGWLVPPPLHHHNMHEKE